MKTYGMILADNGANFFFQGSSYAVDANNQQTLTWSDSDIQDTVHGLKSLTYSDFELLDLTPVVTGLSVQSGAAGTSVTVTGQNFSGAAGHLQVMFGSTPATSVTIVDDAHVVAVAPAGSGTVDVRVQSGITTSANAQNFKNTIFGYGISAISASDQFSYGSSGTTNQAPTVATAAAAAPSQVTGTTTIVSVMGADDGGEANLTYRWTSTGPAAVTFSANGTNAAKTATANFSMPGTYSLLATITDASGLAATSSVNVTVTTSTSNQSPTVATAAKGSPNPVVGKTTTLSVLGADDGGAANLIYSWSLVSGPAPVTFSVNGTNGARSSVATFSKAGTYVFLATITDAAGLSVTSSATVTVQQRLTTIGVTPGTARIAVQQKVQFLATAYDQFGNALTTQPVFTWALTGRGSLSSTGLYTAPAKTGGPYTITAKAAGYHGTATVTVVTAAQAALLANPLTNPLS
jgi:hypothetical protein